MKRVLVLTVLSVALALLGIAVACGSNPITVATIEVGAKCEVTDAGDAGETCPQGQFCSRTSCASNDGVCDPIGADACASSGFECGCDDVSYYNECLRQAARVSLRSMGSCTFPNARQCITGADCPVDGASCAAISTVPPPVNFGRDGGFDFLDGGSFGLLDAGFEMPDGESFFRDAEALIQMSCLTAEAVFEQYYPRTCWVVPDTCPSPASGSVVTCDLKCVDECSAIRDGGFYFVCTPDASAN